MSKDVGTVTMSEAKSQLIESSAPSLVAKAEPVVEIPGMDPADIDDVKKSAQTMLQCGYVDFEDLIERLRDCYELEEEGIPGITDLPESVLQKLTSEQAEWQEDEMVDMKMLLRAFKSLEQKGVISRANFSCCSRCGNAEIRGEASSHHVGYCYFHEQDLDACVEYRGLVLRHGVIGDDFADQTKRVEMASIIVQAMKEVGLTVEWNRDPEKVVDLPGFKWRVRLHDSTHEGKEELGGEIGDGKADLGLPSLDVYVR
jgi:hypothetical protein